MGIGSRESKTTCKASMPRCGINCCTHKLLEPCQQDPCFLLAFHGFSRDMCMGQFTVGAVRVAAA